MHLFFIFELIIFKTSNMKKEEPVRLYKFSDARLNTLGNEKIAYMRRDANAFASFGIDAGMINALESQLNDFEASLTDVEALADQTSASAGKDAKAEELRVAIRGIMTRVALKFEPGSARYRKYGTDTLSKQYDGELLITGRRVVRVGTLDMADLTPQGLNAGMLADITTLCDAFENLILAHKLEISDRDIEQEDRVEAGNAIYKVLVAYTNTGQDIWETSDVAKYNDYIIYNTESGEEPTEAPVV